MGTWTSFPLKQWLAVLIQLVGESGDACRDTAHHKGVLQHCQQRYIAFNQKERQLDFFFPFPMFPAGPHTGNSRELTHDETMTFIYVVFLLVKDKVKAVGPKHPSCWITWCVCCYRSCNLTTTFLYVYHAMCIGTSNSHKPLRIWADTSGALGISKSMSVSLYFIGNIIYRSNLAWTFKAGPGGRLWTGAGGNLGEVGRGWGCFV